VTKTTCFFDQIKRNIL